jgi:hypothetical protein
VILTEGKRIVKMHECHRNRSSHDSTKESGRSDSEAQLVGSGRVIRRRRFPSELALRLISSV